jgi:hypothetical protein
MMEIITYTQNLNHKAIAFPVCGELYRSIWKYGPLWRHCLVFVASSLVTRDPVLLANVVCIIILCYAISFPVLFSPSFLITFVVKWMNRIETSSSAFSSWTLSPYLQQQYIIIKISSCWSGLGCLMMMMNSDEWWYPDRGVYIGDIFRNWWCQQIHDWDT